MVQRVEAHSLERCKMLTVEGPQPVCPVGRGERRIQPVEAAVIFLVLFNNPAHARGRLIGGVGLARPWSLCKDGYHQKEVCRKRYYSFHWFVVLDICFTFTTIMVMSSCCLAPAANSSADSTTRGRISA